MAKNKTVFICQECGYESSGWLGKCPACSKWNTFAEERQESNTHASAWQPAQSKPVSLEEIKTDSEQRSHTGMKEFDRVLGGGVVRGSLILVGGDPGIGKSTLLLQICDTLKTDAGILYISGEESASQIKLRADRLNVKRRDLFIVSASNFEAISAMILAEKPGLVIIDSIQTIYTDTISSAPGSVSQVREVTAALMKMAKSTGITVIIVGHVTKEGAIAGPRVLEHMVDTVLYFEGDRHLSYRILRTVKNRFGSTNEIGVFEMRDTGLAEISNPSEMMLSGRQENVPGSVVVSSLEGTRPMLIEIQSLVCPTNFGVPRRMATGLDYNRLTMLMAVLEKRVGLQLYNYDAYVNVVGGIKLDEPACDLGIAAAVASSFKNMPVDAGCVLTGEVGLTGEVRAVSQVEKRISEAMRLGFRKIIIPEGNMKLAGQMKNRGQFGIIAVSNIQEALEIIFESA
ncbi:MAG: DNA repair protein RadA [Acetivibrionales bacterium]|jgi:DNA repair protein RadA/Sms|nr:DNA repair protein RadA [Bacillota bacterium]NLP08100.1 DNA repair protein RadA [Clostridiaceae bacterium]